MSTPPPPEPFDPDADVLSRGTLLYRVGSINRSLASVNPGLGRPTRFAFFGQPRVPVLYAAETPTAAVAESLLHDVPLQGGYLTWDTYSQAVMGRLEVTSDLRLASLRGLGLRRFGVRPRDVTDTDASEYPRSVAWAQAAHQAGFAGVTWTSRLCHEAMAVVLFGDRAEQSVAQDPSFGRYFSGGEGLDWLIDVCAPLRVDVLPPS